MKRIWIKIIMVFTYILLVSLLVFLIVPKISVEDTTIYLNESYTNNYKANILWFDITDSVKVTNLPDTSKVGKYNVTYNIGFIRKNKEVKVIELTPPVITLEGDNTYYVCPGSTYIEPGFTANDNYDGDITSNVTVVKSDNTITYSVSDSSSNKVEVTRILLYEDNLKPTIELNGGDINLKVGTSYNELGFKAYDNCLGDITDKVIVTNNININTPGTYRVTYSVSDGINETTIYRNVHVTKGIATLGSENSPGVIYLTFDDGPSVYTRVVLDTLKKYNVKATFFVVPKDSSLHYLIKEAYDVGHSIGIHSISHTYSTVYASDDSFKYDVNKTNEIIKSITGNYTYLYRFPGGSSNTASKYYSTGIVSRMASWLHEEGYHYFDWNVSSADADGRSHPAYEIANNVINRLSKSRYNVVLMHDSNDFSPYAVEQIIIYGIDNGYTFAPITMDTKEVHHGIAN